MSGSDGVPRAVFGGDTARMNREAQERLTAACDDAIPREMVGGETTRIDHAALKGLLERSEGMALGTPKNGLPVLDDSVMMTDEPVVETGCVVAVGEAVVEALGVDEAVVKQSRVRDVLIGGFLSLLVMAAWYCTTQL